MMSTFALFHCSLEDGHKGKHICKDSPIASEIKWKDEPKRKAPKE
jgi:hypothetical protein